MSKPWRGWSRLTAAWLAAIMLAVGTGIELVQALPAIGRHAEVPDVVADMVGFALGWGLLWLGRRRGWPGCADGPGRIGCHTMIGSTGAFTRDQRRQLEDNHAAKTREQIVADGLWPANLPRWDDTEP